MYSSSLLSAFLLLVVFSFSFVVELVLVLTVPLSCALSIFWCVEVVCFAVVGCWLVDRVDCVCAWCAYLACFVFGFVAFFLSMCGIFAWGFLELCSVCSIVCSVFLVSPWCFLFF